MEVLVALTLFGFLISGIITFVTAGLDVTQKTEKQLALHLGENQQELQLENLLVHPVTRIDTGAPSAVSTTTGAVFEIDDSTTFVGTQSMTGICTGAPDQQYLVTFSADGISDGETRTAGVYSIASDGLSVYSGSTRIIGSGVR